MTQLIATSASIHAARYLAAVCASLQAEVFLNFLCSALPVAKMDNRSPSPSKPGNHFVDIHEVLPEEMELGAMKRPANKPPEKKVNRSIRLREGRQRQQRSFSRQVSLETGFSVLNRESRGEDNERKVLSRSGLSFGGFEAANQVAGEEGRVKGDFSIFRTKSTLSKQNSMIPLRKERENNQDNHQRNNESTAGMEESVNRSVPAGRYFAALRGPELDEVKVI